MLALAAGVVAAIVAPTLVYVGAKAISNSTAGRNALSDALPEQTFPQTPTAMLATVSDKNELTSVTVFVLAPDSDTTAAGYDQRGGSVVSIPINADPGSGDQLLSLHDAYALGGEEELRAEVESAINLTIDSSTVMKRGAFAGFLSGLPPIQVDSRAMCWVPTTQCCTRRARRRSRQTRSPRSSRPGHRPSVSDFGGRTSTLCGRGSPRLSAPVSRGRR